MTKRHFIKLLMGKGLSRNEANAYAWWAQVFSTPYEIESKDLFYDTIEKNKEEE